MDGIQILSIIVSLALLAFVIELVRRRKLTEEFSFVWILCALALLGLSIGRHLLDPIALDLGIYYPPAVLILVLVFFVFVASVSFSVAISKQRQQIERLIEDTALLEARLRERDEPRAAGSPRAASEHADPVPETASQSGQQFSR